MVAAWWQCTVHNEMLWPAGEEHKRLGMSIHLAVCLTTGPKPLPKRFLHIVRSRASSFKRQYPLLSLRLSSSFPRLLPRLPVTSFPPFTFPSITCCRRQFLRKMWPIQLAFRLLISCRIFLCSLTLSNTSSFLTWMSIHSLPATSAQVFLGFPVSISKCWDGSQDSKLPLHASHAAFPT